MSLTDLPTVVFKCKESYDSFKFEDRTITLDPNGSPVKIGRSQGPLKPKLDNSIFECRVLSRHHAHIWYENESIWVKDKGSSNGTFVNGLKVTSEQVEIKTGDILQFGVDVDNNPRTTYWCVITQVICNQQNYDFKETDWEPLNRYVKACSQSSNVSSSRQTTPRLIQNQANESEQTDEDKVQSHAMQSAMIDAISLQQSVEGKVATMQRIIHDIDTMQKEQWNESLNEDILLTRIENLERKLTVSNNLSESELAFRRLLDEKSDLEMTSKMTLRKSLQEKLEIQNKYDNLKKCLNQSEEDNEQLNLRVGKAEEVIKILKAEEKQLKNETETKDKEIQALKNEVTQAECRLNEEKEKFNINSCLNYIAKEAHLNRLDEFHTEALCNLAKENAALQFDTTKEFVLEEKIMNHEKTILSLQTKAEADAANNADLESLIKSQARELASFFDSLPSELEIRGLDSAIEYIRMSSSASSKLTTEIEKLKAELKAVEIKKDEHDKIAKERLELLAYKNSQNKSPSPVPDSDKLPMPDKTEKTKLLQQLIDISDPKNQIIMFLCVLILAIAVSVMMG